MRDVPTLTGLAAALRDVLNEWDPIGVLPYGAPLDEYDCMIPHLTTLVGQHADADEFAAYLERELVDHFGLQPDPDIPRVARRLADLTDEDAPSSIPPHER